MDLVFLFHFFCLRGLETSSLITVRFDTGLLGEVGFGWVPISSGGVGFLVGEVEVEFS